MRGAVSISIPHTFLRDRSPRSISKEYSTAVKGTISSVRSCDDAGRRCVQIFKATKQQLHLVSAGTAPRLMIFSIVTVLQTAHVTAWFRTFKSEGLLATISASNSRGLGTGDGSPRDAVSECACHDDGGEACGDGRPDDGASFKVTAFRSTICGWRRCSRRGDGKGECCGEGSPSDSSSPLSCCSSVRSLNCAAFTSISLASSALLSVSEQCVHMISVLCDQQMKLAEQCNRLS